MSVPASLAEAERPIPRPAEIVDYRIVDDSFVTRRWILGIVAGALGSGYFGLVVGLGAVELADAESLVALKDLVNRLGSDNTVVEGAVTSARAPAHALGSSSCGRSV